ncbi:Bro-N domain-containing protein [Anaerotignum lactatifermentans]|uniref:BRO-N domain-containing protein n=1 Tax=Anaerotignum lactatifermentans TaxID=160404 RepID=UPI003AB11BC1
MNGLQVFQYEGKQVRTVEKDGETWWVLKDVCAVLGILKHRDVAARLDADERGSVRVDTLGGTQEMVCVNESGLYHVILRSDKPQAKPFRRWVTKEVLPEIRRKGSYGENRAVAALAEQVGQLAEMVTKMANDLYGRKEPEQIRLIPLERKETYSASELLKYNGVRMSVYEFNQMMEEKGYMEEIVLRSLRKGKERRCKVLTEKGLPYGENREQIRCNKGHQPGYYPECFLVLVEKITE